MAAENRLLELQGSTELALVALPALLAVLSLDTLPAGLAVPHIAARRSCPSRRNHVSAVFHGHDHFFARQDLDGIVYQMIPQPGFSGPWNPRRATDYGYLQGVILGGSGHLRVTVTAKGATVDFIRASLPDAQRPGSKNGEVAYTYAVSAAVPRAENR